MLTLKREQITNANEVDVMTRTTEWTVDVKVDQGGIDKIYIKWFEDSHQGYMTLRLFEVLYRVEKYGAEVFNKCRQAAIKDFIITIIKFDSKGLDSNYTPLTPRLKRRHPEYPSLKPRPEIQPGSPLNYPSSPTMTFAPLEQFLRYHVTKSPVSIFLSLLVMISILIYAIGDEQASQGAIRTSLIFNGLLLALHGFNQASRPVSPHNRSLGIGLMCILIGTSIGGCGIIELINYYS